MGPRGPMTTGWDGFAPGFFLGPIVCVMGSRGQNITIPRSWDGMGPLGLYVGWGRDGKLGRLSSMGTTWESTKSEMGWDGMRLMCHTVGGRRRDCVVGNVKLYVRSSTGQHVPNNQLRTRSIPYTVR